MNKNIICSSDSSSNEYLLENNTEHNSRIAGNIENKILVEETMDSNRNINPNKRDSIITATESALHRSSKFNLLYNSDFDDVDCVDDLYSKEPSSVSTTDQMQALSCKHISKSFIVENRMTKQPSESYITFPPAHTSCKTSLEFKALVHDSLPTPEHITEKHIIVSGDKTTVSKGTEQNSKENKVSPQTDETERTETFSRKSNNGIYHFRNKEIYHIDEDASFVRPQSFFSTPSLLNSISFDEDALIHEFELQSLEDRMSVSECISGTNEYEIEENSDQLVCILTNDNKDAVRRNENFSFPRSEPGLSRITRCSNSSSNVKSLTEDVVQKETIMYSGGSDFLETPSTSEANLSNSENLKHEDDWLPTVSNYGNIKENVLLKEEEDQLKRISHAYSDPALSLSDTTICESLRKVKSSEKQYKLQFSTGQDLVPPLVSPEEIQSVSSSHSGSGRTPSSEHKVMINGMVNVELTKHCGGFLHMETEISGSQLTFTEADISSKALKVSDQDFSSCSLPYTEADISSIEFPCTEQDIESSVIFTDADTSSYGLPYNAPEDTSSGQPQIDIETNNICKLHKEIDTSSYGISSNEFDASSSVFDSSSSGLPYIECESTNRLSYRTPQSCSSGHDVDSLSAGSSGNAGKEMSVPEPEPLLQPPVSTCEAPCKDQLKCFPF